MDLCQCWLVAAPPLLRSWAGPTSAVCADPRPHCQHWGGTRQGDPGPAPYFPANWKCLVGYGLISILGFNAVRRDGSQNYSLENIQNNDLWTLLHLQNNKRTKQYNHIINRDKTSKPKSIYWINVALTIQANYSQENYLTFESFFYL